jgi:hypothetical protein
MPKLIWQEGMDQVKVLLEIAMATFYLAPSKMEEALTFLLQIEEGTKALRNKNAPKVWHPVTQLSRQLQATVHLSEEALQ